MGRTALIVLDETPLFHEIFVAVVTDIVPARVADMLRVCRLRRESAITAITIGHLVSSTRGWWWTGTQPGVHAALIIISLKSVRGLTRVVSIT